MSIDVSAGDAPFLVACLCAAWCRTCDEYRATFEALQRQFGEQARFRWVDIEDDEDALGSLDVVDFPTLLVAEGDTIHFAGPVLPHAQAARQLIERALRHELAPVADAALAGLPGRIAALRG
ncbi:MAG: thioredoxin family protein [Piscinibacter sp.]